VPAPSESRVAPAAALAGWLIVVRREQASLFRHLVRRFADVPLVEVVLDRRLADRRQTPGPVAAERRRADRRTPPSPADREHWRVFGYRLARRPGPVAPPD
jgi:hypothetical protein